MNLTRNDLKQRKTVKLRAELDQNRPKLDKNRPNLGKKMKWTKIELSSYTYLKYTYFLSLHTNDQIDPKLDQT